MLPDAVLKRILALQGAQLPKSRHTPSQPTNSQQIERISGYFVLIGPLRG